jgi:predicted deacetylase
MVRLVKPIAIALKGKGPAALMKRVGTISKRYGVNTGKMDHALNQLSQLLQEFDCRATLPITTVALARNAAVIQKYQAQGIEFAIHGYRHIDHSQLSKAEQEDHFRQANQIFQAQGIHCEGFRCPYLRWNEGTLAALSKINFSYDSSNSLVWEVDHRHGTESYYRAIEFYGAKPAKDYLAVPKLDSDKDLVRIPYCLPDDESLIERLVWRSPAERDAVWPNMFQQTHQQGELFNLGLHPERTADCAGGLRATMQKIQAVAPEVWRVRLNEVAQWWRARYKTEVKITPGQDNTLQLTIDGPEGTILLVRSLETKTATKAWFDKYHQATELPCLIETNRRPIIGISPDTSPLLSSFLKQQGYIIEISTEPELYTFYLDRKSFSAEEEKPLVQQIENDNFPLVRLGRWPYGAKSAFCVTGDIDALTVWDYGLRFMGH